MGHSLRMVNWFLVRFNTSFLVHTQSIIKTYILSSKFFIFIWHKSRVSLLRYHFLVPFQVILSTSLIVCESISPILQSFHVRSGVWPEEECWSFTVNKHLIWCLLIYSEPFLICYQSVLVKFTNLVFCLYYIYTKSTNKLITYLSKQWCDNSLKSLCLYITWCSYYSTREN